MSKAVQLRRSGSRASTEKMLLQLAPEPTAAFKAKVVLPPGGGASEEAVLGGGVSEEALLGAAVQVKHFLVAGNSPYGHHHFYMHAKMSSLHEALSSAADAQAEPWAAVHALQGDQ